MALDLETLRNDVQAYFDEAGLPVFYGYYRLMDATNQVNWDVEMHPDFREFLATGQRAGVQLFVYSYQSFSLDQIDDALELLDDSMLPPDEKRSFETRLRQLQAYEGFTCSLDLSFSFNGQTYTYGRETEWYQSLNEILAELEVMGDVEEPAEEDGLGGYFSKN